MRSSISSGLRNTLLALPLIALLGLGSVAPVHAAASVGDAQPDRIALTPTETPENSQSFTWRTGADVTEGFVSIRPAASGDEWRRVDAYHNAPLSGENGFDVRTHSATVKGLEPGTEYEYTVGTDDVRSDIWKFTTAGSADDAFTFLYFGDAQNQLTDTWGPVVNDAFAYYPEAVGTVHAGDLINRSNSSEWTEWFGGMHGYSQTTNIIAAPGNHEYTDDSFMRHWKSNFEYPANGPKWSGEAGETDAERQVAAYRAHMADVLTETVYFTDYQGVRFIALNASRSQARSLFTPDDLPSCLIGCPDPVALWLEMQSSWLDAILANNPNRWAVATFHQPVFSTATGRDEKDLREAWLPVFQRGDIDLVLMGHDHTYARGYVDSDATDVPGVTTGPVYAVAVAGPKYYDQQPIDNNVWTQNGATQVTRAGFTSTFQGITVDGNTLTYESIVAKKWDGEDRSTTEVPVGGLLDSFTITKYDDGSKYVTEQGVEVPGPGEVTPVEPEVPVEMPEEEPAETAADAALVHFNVDGLTSPTVRGPIAFDDATGTLFIGDASETGVGRVEAIDVATDTVLRSFDIGSPITSMSFTPAEGGLLLVASAAGSAGRANGFSTNPAFFGTPALDDDIPMPARVRGVTIDPGSSLVYFALAVGAVAVVDIDEGDIVGQVPIGPGLHGLKVDEATGNVYLVNDLGASSTLDIYQKGLDGTPIRSFELAAGARAVDIDAAAGLAYVSHSGDQAGVSAVDVLDESVRHEAVAGTLGVATSPRTGRVYVSTDSNVAVLARAQAPIITQSPQAVVIDEGEGATLTAAARAVPAPTVQWQVRETEAWSNIEGAMSPELEVAPNVSTQYRAVFSNEIDGETYSTASATATVVVREPTEADPGPTPPSVTPDPVEPSQFTPDSRGSVTAQVDGRNVTIHLSDEHDGQWVASYLHSTPHFLGWRTVSGGSFTVQVPQGTTGEHTIAVLDASGALIGWVAVNFADSGSSGGHAGDTLASTGETNGIAVPLAIAGALLLAGGILVAARMRRKEVGAADSVSAD